MDDPALSHLFADLTPPQAQAVRHTEGPLLIVAAAGSGKTRVITRRIAYLIGCGVPPWSILALTFTNKAAGEMRERVLHLLGGAESRQARGLTVTTFHALCARLLRKYADQVGLKPDFAIFDASDQAALCKKVIASLNLSTDNFPPRNVLGVISNAKNKLQSAEQFAQTAYDFSTRNIAKIYSTYSKALRAANAVDFDDLLLLTAKGLRSSELFRIECQKRWQYLLIDEYQDTNSAQFEIASLIAGSGQGQAGPNICVVGDPDQSIYGWRGADISNILDFEEHYKGAAVILLGENFRSTAPILTIADTLIKNNKRRKPKPLFTSRKGGSLVDAVLCRDERHEATCVVEWFKQLHEGDSADAGEPWREMAIFYRTNSLSRVMEEALRTAGVPYTIARGTAFYEREEIRSALAYLRLVGNPADDVSLARIMNVPARGIGDASLTRLEQWAAATGETLLEAMRQASSMPEISSRGQAAIARFVTQFDSWTGNGTFMGAEVSGSLSELVDRILKESGLEGMYRQQAQTSRSEADEARLDNLAELVSSAREFELEYDPDSDPAAFPGVEQAAAGLLSETPPLLSLLRAYLESVTLVADADAVDPSQGSITLMTLHAAKGLEFGAVAMIGMEENTLPHSRARESESELEEERRLCFVGITRAMRRLLLTAAQSRTIRGLSERTIPSRFLAELPMECMNVVDRSSQYAAAPGWDDLSQLEPEDAPGSGRAATGLAAQFPVGAKVRHPQFGIGEVKAVTPGTQTRAEVFFRDVGRKTLILEYARLTRLP
jgi:DNA helicase-2/ATP-dependent DNA helicase PcrA